MALPQDSASSSPLIADYLSPYDRYKTPLVDWERGGIALADPSEGVDFQVWKLVYDGDEESPTYGDFTLYPEDEGDPVVVINVPDVRNVALAFDPNCHVFIAYYLKDGSAKYYWYDTLASDYTTDTLPAGSTAPAACLDDHRDIQVREGVSDIIMAYTRGGIVYYRQERDRFLTERQIGTGVGSSPVDRVGMTWNLRLKFLIGGEGKVRLSTIVGDICRECGINADQVELDELYPTLVRGYWSSQVQAGADLIRGLQRVYFFDLPDFDGKLWGLMRGRDPVAWIPHSDLVIGSENVFSTAREQELEFPRKLHLQYHSAETDYAPTKQTSERLSSNVRVRSETTVECFINLEADEAAQRAEILHKSAWAEFEGRAEFGLSEAYIELAPADIVMVEVRPSVWRRLRIEELTWSHGILEVNALTDRKSAWSSGAVSPTIYGPVPPASSLPGATTWEAMDLPALLTSHDILHYLVSGHGSKSAWRGFELQRESGTSYQEEAQITYSQTLGLLDATLPAAPAEFKDVTNSIIVTTNKPLYSATYDELLIGKNAAVIGDEIIQFQNVTDLGGGQWQLDILLRGRLNTTPTSHAIGTRFVLLMKPRIVPADVALLDQTFNLRGVSYGTVPALATPKAFTFTGESQREWEPVNLVAVKNGSDWEVSWWHRKRLGNSVTPIDSQNFEGFWRITFDNGVDPPVTKESSSESYTYTSADQTTDFGSAQTSWSDVQVVAVNRLTGDGHPANTGAVS
jgi:hypothetical protein